MTIRSGAENDFTFKLVLAGNAEVGKSCLMTRFVEDRFNDIHVSTIGVDFKTVTTMVGGKVVKLHIWDTAGQERFAQVTSHYYRGADGAVIVYDCTNMESFMNVSTWVDAIESANSNTKEISLLLVGNKSDLEPHKQVTTAMAKEAAKKYDAPFIETSAKTSTNVDMAFLKLARVLVEKKKKEKEGKSASKKKKSAGISLDSNSSSPKKNSCCK